MLNHEHFLMVKHLLFLWSEVESEIKVLNLITPVKIKHQLNLTS
jgi:hypothetical protein